MLSEFCFILGILPVIFIFRHRYFYRLMFYDTLIAQYFSDLLANEYIFKPPSPGTCLLHIRTIGHFAVRKLLQIVKLLLLK